jgi:hypothetical protein
MGMAYNIPPVRLKDIPYLDVLSESANNPIRFALGWFSVGSSKIIPISVILSYWMFGAFLMAVKRYAEYNYIGNPERAKNYRKSFGYYDKKRLLCCIIYYATTFGLFLGLFIMHHRVELILGIPFIAGFVAYYLKLGFRYNSPVQYPEKLFKVSSFFLYTLVCFFVLSILLFMDIPYVYVLFMLR